MNLNRKPVGHERPKLQIVGKPDPEPPTTPVRVLLTPQEDRESMAEAWLNGRGFQKLHYSNRSFGYKLLDVEGCIRFEVLKLLRREQRNQQIAEFVRRAA